MSTSTLKHEDLRQMQAWGRLYALTARKDILHNAAEYVVAANPEDVSSLQFWWEEGVRNNVKHMGHYDDCMWSFRDRITFVQNNT